MYYKQKTNSKPWLAWLSAGFVLLLLVIVLVNGGDEPEPDGNISIHYVKELELPPADTNHSDELHVDAAKLDIAEPANTEIKTEDDVTLVSPVEQPPALRKEIVVVKRGQSLARIFKKLGVSSRDLHHIVKLSPETKSLANLHPGDKLIFYFDEKDKLAKLTRTLNLTDTLIVERKENAYVAAVEQQTLSPRETVAEVEIKNSLYVAGQKAGISDKLIMQLADMFAWDIDFVQDIRPGDKFALVYEELYLGDEKVDTGKLLAARFINQGEVFEAVRYTDTAGKTNYYAADGTSLKREFIRTPVKFTRISSKFDMQRRHPVLHTIRAHKGVDYAASTGTPVKASGDGVIQLRAVYGGYGNAVVIDHGKGYTTLYGHLSRFAKGQAKGSRVKQGDVIGYVGMTGLATGPHLHYEFRINGVHHDPLTVKLPKAAPINVRYKEDFLAHAKQWLSKLPEA